MTLARRRFLMFCTATATSATIGGMVWRARTPSWSRGPKLRDGQPILRMPISAGQVALCQQGNSSPQGFTHSGGNCLYALDLSNCAEETVEVVAAASGRVSYLYEIRPLVIHRQDCDLAITSKLIMAMDILRFIRIWKRSP
ncbi:MAG TPA: hypothetical protein PK156_06070 [Polyangium sp.]|nr:hypothetical protein [Polyangium sp.]